MLFTYRSLSPNERRVLDRIAEMRRELRFYVQQEPRRWTGLLARMTRAKALRASNSIEGIHVSAEDALAAVDNEDPADADKENWQAVRGYHAAMEYILQRCREESFIFSLDVILAVHFMISQHDLSANPGRLRQGWIGVHNSISGELVHEGVDRSSLEPLLNDLIGYMNDPDVESPILKGAMAHLNFTLLHPFSDGNGRTARCLQTAALASEGIISPIFSSIEEYIGRNQQEYYDVLAETGGGGWNPDRDCQKWIRFCITAHYRQAQTLLKRTHEFERLYAELSVIVKRHGLQDRTTMAILQAAIAGSVRNSSYRVSADISNNLASRDLKVLVDSNLVVPHGEKRGRYYSPSDEILRIRRRTKLPKSFDDPFDDPELVGAQQLPLL